MGLASDQSARISRLLSSSTLKLIPLSGSATIPIISISGLLTLTSWPFTHPPLLLAQLHVQSFWTFCGISQVKPGNLPFVWLLAVASKDLALMEKDILTFTGSNESIPFARVKPLHPATSLGHRTRLEETGWTQHRYHYLCTPPR
jgi:hypothetical protein